MSLAAILEALSAAGATNDMLVAAARAHEAAQAAEEESRLAKKRAGNAERQRRFRAAHTVVSNESNALQGVTERYERDAIPPSSSPLSSPPTPPPIIPLSPSPQTSLRSDTSASEAIVLFEQFWSIYPRKTEKKAAATKFFSLVKSGTDPEAIIAGARRYAASKPEPKYTKHPTTWLNRGCWEDEQLPRDGPKRESGSFMAYVASGQWKRDLNDEQPSSEYQSGPASRAAEPNLFGPDCDVPEPSGSDGGGALLDLRRSDAGWY